MLRYIVVRIIIYLLPAALIAYGDHQIVLNIFPNAASQKKLESVCFVIGILSTVVIFPAIIEGQKKKLGNQSKAIKKILKDFRDVLNTQLSNYFNKSDLYLNIRIFLPKKSLFSKDVYFEMHNFEGSYTEEVGSLSFQVTPKQQGLVGLCHVNKDLVFDFNLKANQRSSTYNLKNSQIQKTDYCEFAIAAPIFNEKDETIDTIITFDSKIKVSTPADNLWEAMIKEACKTIHLCKPLINNKNTNYEF